RTIPSAVIIAARKPGAETGTRLAFTGRSQPDHSRPCRERKDTVRVERGNRGSAQIRVSRASTPPGRLTGLAPSHTADPSAWPGRIRPDGGLRRARRPRGHGAPTA